MLNILAELTKGETSGSYQGFIDSNYTECCDIKFITSVYGKEGLVLEYDFDYESPVCKCLLDLWNTRKAHPDRWMYRIDRIYDKYGVDTVNLVRNEAGY